MAFEDRCSPNQASSPGPVTGRVPAPHAETMTTGYQNQYTCTTINQRYDQGIKVQPDSPPPSPDHQEMFQNQEYQYYRPETPDIKPVIENRFEPEKYQQQTSLTFSISNILQPEFGLNALRKTSKLEGPRNQGPNHSILYKPYDLSKSHDLSKAVVETPKGYNAAKTLKYDLTKSNISAFDQQRLNVRVEDSMPPLGGLRQTISQIGETKETRPEKERQVEAQKRPDSASSAISSSSSVPSATGSSDNQNGNLWPAWVFCTRYSDRPSSGPRSRRAKKKSVPEEKRPRTAFSSAQLARLKHEFVENRYLTERRRQSLAAELGLAEAQIKIWFQNKRAKIKKASGQRNPLALQLMAQGLYNHSTVTESEEEEEIQVT